MKTEEQIIQDIKDNLEMLSPDVISTYAIQLSMYMGFLGEQIAKADMAFNKKWEEIRFRVDTDGQAERKSKATEEYFQKKLLETKYKSLKELVNALKRRLNVLSDEVRLSR